MKLYYKISCIFYSLFFELCFYIIFINVYLKLKYQVQYMNHVACKLDNRINYLIINQKFNIKKQLHYNFFYSIINKKSVKIYSKCNYEVGREWRYFIYLMSVYNEYLLIDKYVFKSKVLFEKKQQNSIKNV